MVDTVLYFEGERGHQFRILRAVKNRFGPADEIGVFEMTGAGLAEVANPSALFLSERDTHRLRLRGLRRRRGHPADPRRDPGARRPRRPRHRAPHRRRLGRRPPRHDPRRARGALRHRASAASDVYLNVAGGLRISEPAADLAVAAALVSARQDIALPRDAVFFGEISLSGALRPTVQAEARLREAAKLGFAAAYAPSRPGTAGNGLALHPVADLAGVHEKCFGTIDR